ncbi:MAG: hypothetical protein Q9P14_08020 [candidate division KSB1 bacterium]|nr:hypothetical protein [candidate division KSB1 bacterium]
MLGLDFTHWRKAQLVAARFAFDALFPFVVLILVSYVTRPPSRQTLDWFFAKIHSPVQATLEEDARLVKRHAANMQIFQRRLLFPGTQWELHKPQKADWIGFFGTWGLVGLIIMLLWLVVNIGK